LQIGIAIESDSKAQNNITDITSFSDALNIEMENSKFGNSVLNIFVGFICMATEPGFEQFFKERKPRFKKKQISTGFDGVKIEDENVFTYDIKLSNSEYETFCAATKNEAISFFAKHLVSSFSKLDHLKTRLKGLDIEELRNHLVLVVNKLVQGGNNA
jgi:hypothetical protein